ncbi:MAG: endonuclease III [Candidatus Peribacteraceae bacterium]|nr:endonuclease III [Candidatus Peribacteraceae bacterium]
MKRIGLRPEIILQALKRLYRPPRSFLNWKTPLDLLVATILSAQCTDKRVNIVTQSLFKKLRNPQDYVRIPRRELEQVIHSCGTFRAKARYIQELCRILLEKHQGKVPRTMEELVHLPGVGRKTAAIVLYGAFNKNEGIATDTHVMRLARRLGLTRHKTQGKIERDLMEFYPRKEWGRMNALFISHGRAVCTAKNRQCEKCVFRKQCPSSLEMGKGDLSRS